jgi:aldehyde:ferredoxin oxidoreductase
MRIGERVFNLSWAFNAREGINRKDNELPSRFSQPLQKGATANQTISKKHLSKMLDEYYLLRGWNLKTGLPTKEKLKELELQFALNELETQNIL